MFEKDLEDKFKRIFGVNKVTLDLPSDSQEQDTLFIEVEEAVNTIKDGRARARITGNATIFGMALKVPFGFFSKAIAEADHDDVKDLFFFDFEKNTRRFRNIVQRQVSFIYFFDSQYDPEDGSITSVDFIEET